MKAIRNSYNNDLLLLVFLDLIQKSLWVESTGTNSNNYLFSKKKIVISYHHKFIKVLKKDYMNPTTILVARIIRVDIEIYHLAIANVDAIVIVDYNRRSEWFDALVELDHVSDWERVFLLLLYRKRIFPVLNIINQFCLLLLKKA